MALLIGNKAIVEEKKLRDQLIQKGLGEKVGKEVVLDLKETLFLLEKKKIKLEDKKGKNVGKKELLKYASKKEKGFYQKFIVYNDLRERGFCVKTGFKFGFDFRVYPRGKKPGEEHTYWVVNVRTQGERISMIEFSRMIRLAGNLKTILLIAIVDSENDINYYEVNRITP